MILYPMSREEDKRDLRGKFGESDSEVLCIIVVAYLSEKGYLTKGKGDKEL